MKTPQACPAIAGIVIGALGLVWHIIALVTPWAHVELQRTIKFNYYPFKFCIEVLGGSEECNTWTEDGTEEFVNTLCPGCDGKATMEGVAATSFLSFFLCLASLVFFSISACCKKKWGLGNTLGGVMAILSFVFSIIAIAILLGSKILEGANYQSSAYCVYGCTGSTSGGLGWVMQIIALVFAIVLLSIGFCWHCCCYEKQAVAAPVAQPVIVQTAVHGHPMQGQPMQPYPQQGVPMQQYPQGQPVQYPQQGYPQQGVPMQGQMQYMQQPGYPQQQGPPKGV